MPKGGTELPDWVERHEERDARALRALASPVRLTLLERLVRHGPATATQLAEHVGESPSNCSWHLRQLARFGFVEPAEGGKGRERPWRCVPRSTEFGRSDESGELAAASDAMSVVLADHEFAAFRRWQMLRRTASARWQDAALFNLTFAWLTAEEMADLSREVNRLFVRHLERLLDPAKRPAEARMVRLVAWGFPDDEGVPDRTRDRSP